MNELLSGFLREIKEQDMHINYVQVRRGSDIVADYRRPKGLMRLNTWSVSKTFIAMAAGVAIGEGLVSMEDRLADAFPEYVPENAGSNVTDITVRHLLTMSAGLAEPLFFTDSPERVRCQDWIRHFYQAEFPHAPGEHFLYSNFNTYMLACLLEKKVGGDLLEWLKPRLFTPLEIYSPDWTRCPMGHLHAANGLNLNVHEMANAGEMLLFGGEFRGTRILPEAFVREAMSVQVPLPSPTDQYGYFMRVDSTRNCARADGRYNQYIIVCPEKNAVVAVQGLEERNCYPLVAEHILDRL